jgi:hypothetical protein
MASGNEVVRSARRAQKLRDEIHDKICAVEMEAKGLFTAIHRAGGATSIAMVRGLSDFADERKHEADATLSGIWRRYAGENAARLVKAVLDKQPRTPVSPPFALRLQLDRDAVAAFAHRALYVGGAAHYAHVPSLVRRTGSSPALELRIDWQPSSANALRAALVVDHADGSTRVVPAVRSAPPLTMRLPAVDVGQDVSLFVALDAPLESLMVDLEDEFHRTNHAAGTGGPDVG